MSDTKDTKRCYTTDDLMAAVEETIEEMTPMEKPKLRIELRATYNLPPQPELMRT